MILQADPTRKNSDGEEQKVATERWLKVKSFATPWTIARQAPLSMDSPGKNTGVGCHCLLQFCSSSKVNRMHGASS